MSENRRHITLIILKPDGSNSTVELTRRHVRGLLALAVALVLSLGSLVVVTVYQHRRLRRLWDEHQLLVGREIVALSPRPASAGAVPGAAAPPPGEEAEQTVTADARRAPASGEEAAPRGVPAERSAAPGTPSPEQAPARIDAFSLLRNETGTGWTLQAQLTKREWNNEVLRGYVAVLIEDEQRPGRFYSIPSLTVANRYPLSPEAGDDFAIRRLKPLYFEFSLPEDFLMREVRILVYDQQGVLLVEQSFPVEGSP